MDESPILLCGDFNARIGHKTDYIESIGHRSVIDETSNTQGDTFIDFLRDSCCCILNGRFDPDLDNYTCVSTRGVSVVNYIVCDETTLHMISDFRVETMTSIVEKLKLREIMSERGKLSDHSMISCTINVSPYCAPQSTSDTATDSRNTQTSDTVRKYNVSNIPDDFLSHISVKNALLSAIQRLGYIHIRQDDIDSIYNNFVEIVHNEMDNKLDHHDIGCHKPPRSKYRCRPYWNVHLSRLWREARDSD